MNLIVFVFYIEQVSMGFGTITSHALMSLEARGTLFVTPGMEVVNFAIDFCLSLCFLTYISCYLYGTWGRLGFIVYYKQGKSVTTVNSSE
jgi:hypothetical protein